MRKKIGRYAVFLLLIVLSAGILRMSLSADDRLNGEVVRVGYYELQGFQYADALGNKTGYNIEYLKALSSFTSWKYTYIPIKDFNDGMEKLLNQEIDLLAPAVMDQNRAEKFDFSTYSFGTEYFVLVVNDDKENCFYEDYEQFDQMSIAVPKDDLITEYFLDYMEKNNFQAELVYCDTQNQAMEQLENREADAAVSSLMSVKDGQKIVARFSSKPFYYITWKENDKLLAKLNEAMKMLQNNYPTFLDDLQQAYYPKYKEQYFSRKEQDYIESLGVLDVGYLPGRLPVSFRNPDTGEMDGISRLIFDTIQEISGLSFHYVELPYGEVSDQKLLGTGIDLITGINYNSINLNEKEMFLSTPYLESQKVLVANGDLIYDPEKNWKVAVQTGSKNIQKVIEKQHPNFTVVSYDTVDECFQAVKCGEVDLLLQNQYIVDIWLFKPQYEDLKILPIEGLEDKLCFSPVFTRGNGYGLSEQDGRMLIQIINKALSQITEDQMEAMILAAMTENHYNYEFSDFLYQYRYRICIIVCCMFILLAAGGYILYLKKHNQELYEREENKIKMQQKRYQLVIENSDEMIYEISLSEESSIATEKIKQKFGWDIPQKVENLTIEKLEEILHIHPDDYENFFNSTRKLMESKKSDEILVRMQRADGVYIWCKIMRLSLLDEKHNLTSIVGKIVDVDEEMKEKKILQQKSRTDGLTGLVNKQTFLTETTQYLERNSSAGTALVFVDMDHFKQVNDTLGHAMGDCAIVESAARLQGIFGEYGTIARFGGDEFCIFLPSVSLEKLRELLAMSLEKMKAVYQCNGASVGVTASIGVAYCRQEKAQYEQLLELADKAVYMVKERGRNDFEIRLL